MRSLRQTLPLILSSILCPTIALAQGFSVGSKTPPSVSESDLFISIDGRFSISLPQNFHGFTPVSSNSPAGRITGDSYEWKMKEGTFTAGYIDRPEILDETATAKRMLDFMRDSLAEKAKLREGKLIGERSLSGIGHPAREVRIEFPDGLFIQRVFLVSKRMYLVSAVLHKDQLSQEADAVTVIDSFRILGDAELDAAIKRRIAEVTPSPLPQAPVAPRAGIDAKDEGLKGKVKTVLTESEDLSGKWAVGSRKPSSMQYYNEDGNLIKTERYDWKGNLSDIEVYGYIDGDRVSKYAYIRHEYDPPPMMMASAPGQKRVEHDNRYSIKLKFIYDSNDRLIERVVIGNDGELRTRCVHDFDKAKEVESCYSDGKIYYKSTSIVDDRGNVIEKTIERPSSGSNNTSSDRYSYDYQFDSKHNWIKQTTSEWVTKGGRSYYEPTSVYYRTITYY